MRLWTAPVWLRWVWPESQRKNRQRAGRLPRPFCFEVIWMNEAFSRTAIVLGDAAMERLARAHVAVLGLGGVGGYVVEGLARSGVGELTLVDQDEVGLTNLNRQLLSTVDTLGQPKAQAAAERVLSINPQCVVHPMVWRYDPDTREEFFTTRYDYIVDAIDLVSCKLDLIQTALERDIPIISALGTGDKVDPTQFHVADISKTQGCHLARIIRKELRRRGIRHHKVVYSPELPHAAQAPDETPPPGRRSIPGSVAWVPGCAGLILAGAVVMDLAAQP